MDGTKNPEHVVIVGGSSGMGFALAERLLATGNSVTIVGRSPERIKEARVKLGDPSKLYAIAADSTREDDVERLFGTVGEINHIVSTAADLTGAYSAISTMDIAHARRIIDSKVVAPLLLAKHGHSHIVDGGSISFTSGIAAYRPSPTGSVVAAVNGAIESLVYALALELAPIRVNAVSPGWVDTPFWDAAAGEKKAATLDAMAKRLPVGKVGKAADLAQAFESIMRNSFISGTVVHVDGGHRLI
ncbi:SDR family oxidoreductase [Streptomyces guryensis]|uniref:SDR family oxidoreductase n=1 Tax=Streptomyces guryensis TaxID=2886947 RepID=A0A9Q3VWX0_9ACTN|nr:SDR family oxidoreductase [Streptomyces guryensis]MCD9878948.1 SDR family oxidoreductase [Streptomyces guryensis]